MYYEKDYKDKLAFMYPDVLVRYEVPFDGVRADAVAFTDPITAFEIKSEHDDLTRLLNQVETYFKVFTRVIALVHETKASDAARILCDTPAGIWTMNKWKEIKVYEDGRISDQYISHTSIYNVLRKPEREFLLRKYFGDLPDVGDFRHYKDRLERFQKIPKVDLIRDLGQFLKVRYEYEQYSGVPGNGDLVVKLMKHETEKGGDNARQEQR